MTQMEEVCRHSPIPVALDEELIGKENSMDSLLERIRPQFIILKPSLHGGFYGCQQWISKATSMGIGWWITSALESNIGLNAICQFTANYEISLPQGLGTGLLYENNIESPLTVSGDSIYYKRERTWSTDHFFA